METPFLFRIMLLTLLDFIWLGSHFNTLDFSSDYRPMAGGVWGDFKITKFTKRTPRR